MFFLAVISIQSGGSRRFQNFERSAGSADVEQNPHAKRQSNVLPRNMPGPQSISHRHSQVAHYSHDDILQRTAMVLRKSAIEHFSKDDTSNSGKFPSEFQVHQHAVDLIRSGRYIFDEKYGAVSLNFVGRTQGRNQHG